MPTQKHTAVPLSHPECIQNLRSLGGGPNGLVPYHWTPARVSYRLPDVLYRVAGGFYKSLYKKDEEDHERLVPRTERCSSLPKHLRADRDETTPTSGPASNEMDIYVPLTPPPTPTLKPELRDNIMSVYYMGAMTCILERAPNLVHGASKICGASSGCLVAAALTVGLPIEHLYMDVLSAAKEARKHRLSVFHPTFSLLRTLRDSLREKLPEDAHRRASGRLCVSITRIRDGRNVLVSHFDSREELIQVLMCSCFFPVYCGLIPPSYRGQLYMDGALSNNMPLLECPNTITVAPFCSESDISPKDGAWTAISVYCNNLSIQVTTGNVRRIYTSFLPPTPEELAEIFHSGYTDALCFLRQEDLLATSSPEELVDITKEALGDQPWRLEHKHAHNLPLNIKRVLCVACRDAGDRIGSQSLCLVEVFYYVLTPLVVAVELIWFLLKSLLRTTNNLRRQNSSCHDNNCTCHRRRNAADWT